MQLLLGLTVCLKSICFLNPRQFTHNEPPLCAMCKARSFTHLPDKRGEGKNQHFLIVNSFILRHSGLQCCPLNTSITSPCPYKQVVWILISWNAIKGWNKIVLLNHPHWENQLTNLACMYLWISTRVECPCYGQKQTMFYFCFNLCWLSSTFHSPPMPEPQFWE